MITCFLKYTLNPAKIDDFKQYGKMWIDLVNVMGGVHHGYLIPYEGPNNIGYASFSFPSLADYEVYRAKIPNHAKCQEAMNFVRNSGCVLYFERSFMKPLFSGINDKARIE